MSSKTLTKKELELFEKFLGIFSQMQHQQAFVSPLYYPQPNLQIAPKQLKIKDEKKKKKHNGLTYLTKSVLANKYVVFLMEYINNLNLNFNLNHTQVDEKDNIYTTYTDVTLLLRKYLEYKGFVAKDYIQLDAFLWDLLGFEFTEEMIKEKKIIEKEKKLGGSNANRSFI